MKKEIEIRFDKNAYLAYKKLQKYIEEKKPPKKKPTYEQLLSSINFVLNNLKYNPSYGNLIPKKYLSKSIINRYGTNKIFKVNLIGYWRLLYTLIGDEVKVIAFILEFVDHDKYNKIFGYKKK